MRKERNPLDYLSARYPLLNLLNGKEKQEFWIEDQNCTYGVCMNNLRKSWKGYIIAKSQGDTDAMMDYASRIQDIQKAIGFKVAQFDCLVNI